MDNAMPTGTLIFYCGNLKCGYAIPQRNKSTFRFSSCLDIIDLEPRTNFTIDEITTDIELSLKEFCSKVIRPSKLIPISKINSI